MTRRTIALASLIFSVAAGIAAVPLLAQPDIEPVRSFSATEFVLPPGTYRSLVVSYEGPPGRPLRAVLAAASGEVVMMVQPGTTFVLPLSDTGWVTTQEFRIKAPQGGSAVSIAAMTPSGPVKLDPPKK